MTKTIRIAPSEVEASSAEALEKAKRLLETTVAERYKVEAVMIASDTGAIYRAAHVHLRKRVALKVVYAGAPEAEIARLEREAIAGAHVRHANVAGATDTGVLPDGARYLSIEHVPGVSLSEVLRLGPLSVERAVRIAHQLAAALSAAHHQGVVHRNLEPRNVLLAGERGDEARLVDFGRAKLDLSRFGSVAATAPEEDLDARTVMLTTSGIIEWSTAYLPPEAVLGSSVLDERSDLYSLGVVLFEMVAGKRPFDAESPTALFAEQRQKRLPRVSERAPGVVVPEALEHVLARLLAIERSERHVSADELAEALAAIKPAARRPGSGQLARTRPIAVLPKVETTGERVLRRAGDVVADVQYRLRGVMRAPSARPVLATVVVCALAFTLWMALSRPARQRPTRAMTDATEVDPPPRRTAPPGPASASASISITPVASSGVAAIDLDEPDANAFRSELARAVESENWSRAAQAIAALARLDPKALSERGVAGNVVSTATALETAGGKQADAVFGVLESGLGTEGLWLLFEIVRTKGGTRGSERAARMLGKPEIESRVPAALRIALLLVTTPCSEKRALFDRAADEGDERALTALRALQEMDQCPRRRPNPCCFKHDKQLEQAIERLASKLAKP